MAESVAVLKLLLWLRRVLLPPAFRRGHARELSLPPSVEAPNEGEDYGPV
jgi:hypothetical protein